MSEALLELSKNSKTAHFGLCIINRGLICLKNFEAASRQSIRGRGEVETKQVSIEREVGHARGDLDWGGSDRRTGTRSTAWLCGRALGLLRAKYLIFRLIFGYVHFELFTAALRGVSRG
jgi:hypothetical protein